MRSIEVSRDRLRGPLSSLADEKALRSHAGFHVVTAPNTIRLGLDIGGTFTDVALEAGGRRVTAFTARDYYPAMLFHLTRQPRIVFRLDSFEAVVIVQQDGDRLLIEVNVRLRDDLWASAEGGNCPLHRKTIEPPSLATTISSEPVWGPIPDP